MLEANVLFSAAFSNNTWKTYENGLSSFNKFREQHFIEQLWPPPISHIASFISYLAYNSFSPSTARSYISGLSFYLKWQGYEDNTQSFVIKTMLKGMNRLYGMSDLRLPITVEMMRKFPLALMHVCTSTYEATMFNAAFSLAFSAFLRVGEITCSNPNDSLKLIQKRDITLHESDKSVTLKIKFSKTDQIGKSCTLCIQRNELPFSTFLHLSEYLKIRPEFEGPLFCHLNRKHISRRQFVTVLHSSLKFLGYHVDNINTHSFRIGAATYFASIGLSDDAIKVKGRWTSSSFQRYIRL